MEKDSLSFAAFPSYTNLASFNVVLWLHLMWLSAISKKGAYLSFACEGIVNMSTQQIIKPQVAYSKKALKYGKSTQGAAG